jgi:hypothetical protein
MDNVLVRFVISVPSALLVASGFNYFNHRAYYATIFNSQTVDFNILAHTLPTKLSLALQKGDLEEIQNTLNSNYGLFGIVLTDCKEEYKECKEQKIIAMSQPRRQGWEEKQLPEGLSNSQYNILRKQALTTAEWEFKDARSTETISTGRTNQGEIIGRVYYVRRDAPDLIKDQINWLLIPLKSAKILINGNAEQSGKELYKFVDSGANKYYFLTNLLGLVAGLSIWRTWERVLYKRRLQQALSEKREKELTIRLDRYKNKSIGLEEKVKTLQICLNEEKEEGLILKNELRVAREVLEKEQEKADKLQIHLIDTKQKLERSKQDIAVLEKQIQSAEEQVSEKLRLVSFLQEQVKDLKHSDNELATLQTQLEKAILDANSSQESVEEFHIEIQIASQHLAEKERDYLSLSNQFTQVQEVLSAKEEDIHSLQENLATLSNREYEYQKAIRRLQEEKSQLEMALEKTQVNYEELLVASSCSDQQLDELLKSIDREIQKFRDENSKLEERNQLLETRNNEIENRLKQLEKLEVGEEYSDEEISISFSTVFQALQAAEEHFSILEIWDSAKRSAFTLNFYLPNRVYRDLAVLAEVAKSFFERSVGNDLDAVFRNRGVKYVPRESHATMSRYGHERRFCHSGRREQMTQHLKIGNYLRIYFQFDDQQQKVLVGYCGKHLRTITG